MPGRMYTVSTAGVSASAAQDLIEITPADDKPIVIHAVYLSQTSDFGDAQDEVLRWEIIRGFTASGSAGTAPTPRPSNRSDAAAAFTAEMNNTTVATTGTTNTLHEDGWNVRTSGVW